eukprot:3439481-Lingulodinium_polyedra.AAC.1
MVLDDLAVSPVGRRNQHLCRQYVGELLTTFFSNAPLTLFTHAMPVAYGICPSLASVQLPEREPPTHR